MDSNVKPVLEGQPVELGHMVLPSNTTSLKIPFSSLFKGYGLWAVWMMGPNGTCDLLNLERKVIVHVRAVHLVDANFVRAGYLTGSGRNDIGRMSVNCEWPSLDHSEPITQFISAGTATIFRRTGVPMRSYIDHNWPYGVELHAVNYRNIPGETCLVPVGENWEGHIEQMLNPETDQTGYFMPVR